MTGYALPAPKMSADGLPAMLVGLAISGAAVGLLIWWGVRNKQQKEAQAKTP